MLALLDLQQDSDFESQLILATVSALGVPHYPPRVIAFSVLMTIGPSPVRPSALQVFSVLSIVSSYFLATLIWLPFHPLFS